MDMMRERLATLDDARRLLGDVEDHILIEVLAASPSLRELTSAALWERGDGDHEARMNYALNDREAAIVVILAQLRERS